MINRVHGVEAGVQTGHKATQEKMRRDKMSPLKNNLKPKSSFQTLQISLLVLPIWF